MVKKVPKPHRDRVVIYILHYWITGSEKKSELPCPVWVVKQGGGAWTTVWSVRRREPCYCWVRWGWSQANGWIASWVSVREGSIGTLLPVHEGLLISEGCGGNVWIWMVPTGQDSEPLDGWVPNNTGWEVCQGIHCWEGMDCLKWSWVTSKSDHEEYMSMQNKAFECINVGQGHDQICILSQIYLYNLLVLNKVIQK